jgi:hypothetical protein
MRRCRRYSRRTPGRPSTAKTVRDLVIRPAGENLAIYSFPCIKLLVDAIFQGRLVSDHVGLWRRVPRSNHGQMIQPSGLRSADQT